MASFSSGNDNFTASNSKQDNQSSFNATQQAAIKELEDKITVIINSLQNVTNALNDFKEETAADFEAKQDRLIPGSHVAINEANIISSNQINDTEVSGTETYSSDKIKSITDAIENNVNTKANISYVDTNFESIRALIDTKQAKLTAGSGITISDNTISTLNYIDDNEPAGNKSYSSLKTVQLTDDVYNSLYAYINSANYDSTILRVDSDDNRFGSIVHAYSGITPGTYGTKDYADATLLPCFTINSEGHAVDVRLDEIYPPVTDGKTYDYWMSNGSKRGNWQTPDSRPINGSHSLITSGAVWAALNDKGIYEAGLNIDISDYVISCTAIDNENISDTKTFSSSKIQNDMQQLDESITSIEALIPSQATEENILADRDFVNSSINSVTAFYITSDIEGSPFATKDALDNAAAYYYAGTERVPTANDYCVVLEDETHANKTVRYVYQSTEAGEGTWAFQYIVNDTSFTSDQLAALNSGITENKVNKYDAMSSVEYITSPYISAQHNLYRSIVLSVHDDEDVEIEDGDGNCTLIIYNDNSFENVLKSAYGDEITVLGAHEFVVLMYSSDWKVVARQNNDTEKKIFITEAADPVNLTEQDDTHYIVQIVEAEYIPDSTWLIHLPATAKDGATYTITNISDRRLEVYTLLEHADSPFSTRDDSIVIEIGCTMQFVYVARASGWLASTEAILSYYAYEADKAENATYADWATHATTADSANELKNNDTKTNANSCYSSSDGLFVYHLTGSATNIPEPDKATFIQATTHWNARRAYITQFAFVVDTSSGIAEWKNAQHVYTRNGSCNENGVVNFSSWQKLTTSTDIVDTIYPVGSIYINYDNKDPNTMFGGTWVQFGAGRCLIGVGAGTDTNNWTTTFEEHDTGGEYRHALGTSEMPQHTHVFRGSAVTSGTNSRGHTHSYSHTHEYTPQGSITGGNHTHGYSMWQNSGYAYYGTGTKYNMQNVSSTTDESGDNSTWTSKLKFEGTKGTTTSQSSSTSGAESQNHTHSVTAAGTNDTTGSSGYHNNVQPYITVYMWRRTA